MVLRDVALLHERILSSGPLLCRRPSHRDARERHVASGVWRHLHLRQQRARDLGDLRQAEDLRAGTPISTKWIRTGCSRSSTPLRRPRESRPGTRRCRRRSGRTRRRTTCCSKLAWRRGRARTPSCWIPLTVGTCPFAGRAGAALHRDRRPRTRATLTIRAPTGFDFDDRLPSQSFNGSMTLRHRLAQREGRHGNAARTLPARRQQRVHRRRCGTR